MGRPVRVILLGSWAQQMAEIPRAFTREAPRQPVEALLAPVVAQRLEITGNDNQGTRNVGGGSTFSVRGRGGV